MRRIAGLYILILAIMAGCGSTTPPASSGEEMVFVSPSSPNKAVASSLDSVPNLVLIQEIVRRGFTSWGCPEPLRERRASWSPPQEGSPVHHYVLEYTVVLDSIPDTTITLAFPRFWDAGTCSVKNHRVAGIDSLDRQGPFSDPGEIEILEVQ